MIALSLSGGGYRAAAFHLGTIEMLEELGLLSNVHILSTVSGGTIAGAAYATHLAEIGSFDGFPDRFREFLTSTNVIIKALGALSESIEINGFKAMPSLIRSAAGVYALSDCFGERNFNFILSGKSDQLTEISFNATDFRTGNCFRFQRSNNPIVRSGNNKGEVDPEINKMIRLADIVAASSCFPSGFEPIRFPSDFVWPEASPLTQVRQQLGNNFAGDVPLMDGGVYDNQGLDSIENINNHTKVPIDLFIISDTDPRNSVLLASPWIPDAGGLTLKWLYRLIILFQLASLLTAAALVWDLVASFRSGTLTVYRGVFLYFIPLLFTVSVVVFVRWGRRYVISLEKQLIEKTGIDIWTFIKDLSVPELIEFCGSRLKSLIAMSSSVFMKRIRDLGYKRIFSNTVITDKVLPNQIYDLDKNLIFKPEWSRVIEEKELTPSAHLKEISQRAERYATNLWFFGDGEMDNLIDCGRATICFKVMKYLLRFRLDQVATPGSLESELFSKARAVWANIN